MKVLLINGSPKKNGNTAAALQEMQNVFAEEAIETELLHLGTDPVRDCIACGGCRSGKCVFDDDIVNRLVEKAAEADGFVFGTPVYYAHPSGRIQSVLDRAFYCGGGAFRRKPGAALAVARRAGTTASVDVLNKYFTISEMPVVSSSYWNVAHGGRPGEVTEDKEGIQTVRNLARNMAWLLRCIEAGKAAGIEPPQNEYGNVTNFIR